METDEFPLALKKGICNEKLNLTYLPKLASKWISEDGKTLQLVFSDAANGHSTYYKWNMQKITLKMSGEK